MKDEELAQKALIEVSKEVAKDLYNDTTKPTAKNVGGFFGALSGFFNHVVVYPLKKLNIKYEQKTIAFEREMEIKYNNIPEGNRTEAELHIVGPAMESLKYNIMNDDLAEMFSNLLVSDLDNRTQSLCSPAFVKIIEQLSPIDAKVYKYLCEHLHRGALPICSAKICTQNDERQVYNIKLPLYFSQNDIGIDSFIFSSSISNLEHLGLIDFNFVQFFKDEKVYNRIAETDKYVVGVTEALKQSGNMNFRVVTERHGLIKLNDFSTNFAKVCFRDDIK